MLGCVSLLSVGIMRITGAIQSTICIGELLFILEVDLNTEETLIFVGFKFSWFCFYTRFYGDLNLWFQINGIDII